MNSIKSTSVRLSFPLRGAATKSALPFPRFCLLSALALVCGAAHLSAQPVIQTNFGTGDGTVPGPYGISSTDLLQTSLGSPATYSGGTFYRFGDSGYESDLTRLSDGTFGASGAVPSASVLPDSTTITFWLDTTASTSGYTITSIRTYAGWDDGRDGQQYTVQYALVGAINDWVTLTTIARFDNTNFPTHTESQMNWDTFEFEDVEVTDYDHSATLVELTASSGPLATGVAGLRFQFSDVENGGTAFREFDVMGGTTSGIPEPSTYSLFAGFVVLGWVALRRRRAGARLTA